MTPQQIDALTPGPDLDKAVAEHLGYPASIRDGQCYRGFNFQTGSGASGTEEPFSPSTDWNHAMWAAEKTGLFTEKHTDSNHQENQRAKCSFPFLKHYEDGYWVVHSWEWTGGRAYNFGATSQPETFVLELAHGNNGPEAIAKAILALH